MFGKKIRLFKIFGFEVGVDWSWIIIAVLIAWSLSVGLFPFRYKDLSIQTYWIMGIIGALGLFFSIIFHEVCHSLVARKYGMPMKGITLFIFGGVAEMGEEPPTPRAEFMMAIVGPLSSLLMGLIFYGIYLLGQQGVWPEPVNGVLQYLAYINGLLGFFNMIPAFPLDGGRVLRSILWTVKKNHRWATRISSKIGSGFGIFLIILGVFQFLRGNFIGGMWWFLIGMFLKGAAQSSYQQLLLRKTLEGETVERFMNKEPVTAPPSLSVAQLVEDYLYRYHHKMIPIVEGKDRLVGCVTIKQVKEVPRDQWEGTSLQTIAVPCSENNTIEPQIDAMKALSIMSRTGSSRLMVTKNSHLLGIVTLKDLMKFLSLKIELEEE